MDKLAALELMEYDCDTSAGEITEWRDSRDQPGSWDEIISIATERFNSINRRSHIRSQMASQWQLAPEFIRGPFHYAYMAANALLDNGDDKAAAALIEYSNPPASFNDEQLDSFAKLKADLLEAINTL